MASGPGFINLFFRIQHVVKYFYFFPVICEIGDTITNEVHGSYGRQKICVVGFNGSFACKATRSRAKKLAQLL